MIEIIVLSAIIIACSILEKDVEKEDKARAENNNILFSIKREREN